MKEITSGGLQESSASGTCTNISSEFVCPCVERVKVNQYSEGTTIVVTGQQLWFLHSLRLSSTVIKEPFHVQGASACFKTKAKDVDIPQSKEKTSVVAFSYFYQPIQRKLQIEFDVSSLLYV